MMQFCCLPNEKRRSKKALAVFLLLRCFTEHRPIQNRLGQANVDYKLFSHTLSTVSVALTILNKNDTISNVLCMTCVLLSKPGSDISFVSTVQR